MISSWFLLLDSVSFFLSYSSLKRVRFCCCFFFVFFLFPLSYFFLALSTTWRRSLSKFLLVFHIFLLADKILVFHLFNFSLFIYYFHSLFSYVMHSQYGLRTYLRQAYGEHLTNVVLDFLNCFKKHANLICQFNFLETCKRN